MVQLCSANSVPGYKINCDSISVLCYDVHHDALPELQARNEDSLQQHSSSLMFHWISEGNNGIGQYFTPSPIFTIEYISLFVNLIYITNFNMFSSLVGQIICFSVINTLWRNFKIGFSAHDGPEFPLANLRNSTLAMKEHLYVWMCVKCSVCGCGLHAHVCAEARKGWWMVSSVLILWSRISLWV